MNYINRLQKNNNSVFCSGKEIIIVDHSSVKVVDILTENSLLSSYGTICKLIITIKYTHIGSHAPFSIELRPTRHFSYSSGSLSSMYFLILSLALCLKYDMSLFTLVNLHKYYESIVRQIGIHFLNSYFLLYTRNGIYSSKGLV